MPCMTRAHSQTSISSIASGSPGVFSQSPPSHNRISAVIRSFLTVKCVFVFFLPPPALTSLLNDRPVFSFCRVFEVSGIIASDEKEVESFSWKRRGPRLKKHTAFIRPRHSQSNLMRRCLFRLRRMSVKVNPLDTFTCGNV